MADDTRLSWIHEINASFPFHSFESFHESEIDELIDRHGSLLREDIRGAEPFAFRLPGGPSFTYREIDGEVSVIRGDDSAAAVVELDEKTFSNFTNELLTASGTVMIQRARLARGTFEQWQRWEPALRALYSGRPVYGSSVRAGLVDASGEPLDLLRAFTPADSDDEMRAFLNTAGYLHVRGVFDPGEAARLGQEIERCRVQTMPDDGFSWWSVNADGEEVVTRINYLDRFSQHIDEVGHDERLSRLAKLVGPEMRVCDDRLDGPMVFIKNSNVVRGNGDLGWHVDDGIGGHPVMCPLVQTGVQLDDANAENGQLLVLAGSYRCASHWPAWGEEGDLPVVALETRPGDVTVHYADLLHTTPPPTSDHAGRRVLYYKFAEPKTFEFVPARCHYNDALFCPDDTGRIAARAKTWSDDETTGSGYA